jgi:RNA polymerase sigma-70 factor (ECF subfamily)
MSLLSSDRQLLERFRQGDRQALAEVYKAHAPAIAAFLSRGFSFSSKGRTLRFNGFHQPFDLDNALQETFLRAFSDRARLAYDGLTPYQSYLTAIARNFVLSDFRRREVAMSQVVRSTEGGEKNPEVEDLPGAHAASSGPAMPNGETAFLKQELMGLYQSFQQELSSKHLKYFRARFEQRLTQVEAGRKAGLSHMQARTLEKKLRKRFLKFMQVRGYLEGYGTMPAAASPSA